MLVNVLNNDQMVHLSQVGFKNNKKNYYTRIIIL
jgi:hypothetical protein